MKDTILIAGEVDAAELNRRFPMDDDIGRYFTMLYGLLDVQERQFRFVPAGHPGPLHVLASGEAKLLPTSGRPIGFDESTQYKEQLLQLAPGDRLYLYSDGVWEMSDKRKQMFGPCQLLSTLKEIRGLPLQEGLEVVLERARRWSGMPDFNDDASLLGVEFAVQDDAAGRSLEATR